MFAEQALAQARAEDSDQAARLRNIARVMQEEEKASEPQVYAPEPQVYAPEPQAYALEPQAYAPEPQAYAPEPQAYAPEPQAYAPEPQAYAPEPQAYAPEPQAYAPEPQAYAPEPQAYAPEPQAYAPEPQVYAPEPQAYAPEPQAYAPEPQVYAPEPQAYAPEPQVYAPPQPEPQAYAPQPAAISSRVITVTSGKGGVGKTNFTVNLAVALAKAGKRVVILDADFGLANIEVLFGVIPRYNLKHVFDGVVDIKDIVTDGPLGVKFLSGGSGLRELANISAEQMNLVIDKFSFLDSISDIILIDTGAGISDSVLGFIRACDETIIITTPEPTSVTDAYAIIKAAKENESSAPCIKVVINRTDDHKEGQEVYDKISRVAKRFLDLELTSLGFIPYDNSMVKSVKSQKPMLIAYPNCDASKAVTLIAKSILEETGEKTEQQSGIKGFMRKLTGIFKN